MTRLFGEVAHEAFDQAGRNFAPTPIVDNLTRILETLRPLHQEDAHEFMNAVVDKFLLSTLVGGSA